MSAGVGVSAGVSAGAPVGAGALAFGAIDDPVAEASASESGGGAHFVRRFAVPKIALYDAEQCPICEETMSFLFADQQALQQSAADESSGNASRTASAKRRAELLKSLNARANLAQENQNQHKLIYEMEQTLRGEVRDKQILRMMLTMRRESIERDFEAFEIKYVAWTYEMLQEHFDPKNGHMRQPLREQLDEHETLRETFTMLKRSTKVPDPQNPTQEVPHLRAIEIMLRTKKSLDESRDKIELQRQKSGNINDQLRGLVQAIERLRKDKSADSLTTDPEMAAGTVAMAGDSRTTAANFSEQTASVRAKFVSGW